MAKVVIVGDSAVSAELISQIASYNELCTNSTTGHVERQDIPFGYQTSVTVNNKYFSAQLDFHVFDEGVMSQLTPEQSDDFYANIEGVLLTASEAAEFNTSGASAAVGERLAEAECSLRLLAFNKTGGEIPSNVMEWSLDNGFECIQRDPSDPVSGWQDREKEGLPRLMEALQTSMWSSMVKVKPPAAAGDASAAPAAGAGAGAGVKGKAFTLRSTAEMAAAESRIAEAASAATAAAPAPTQQEATASAGADTASTSASTPASTSTPVSTSSSTINTSADEESVEMFSEMMTQAQRLRDEVKSGSLTDDERRRRAAEMAFKLSSMLNLGESDDEEDEDDE